MESADFQIGGGTQKNENFVIFSKCDWVFKSIIHSKSFQMNPFNEWKKMWWNYKQTLLKGCWLNKRKGLNMKLHWKENTFQVSFILWNAWLLLNPRLMQFDSLTTFTALSFPGLSKATSETHNYSNPVNLQPFFEIFGCIIFWFFKKSLIGDPEAFVQNIVKWKKNFVY